MFLVIYKIESPPTPWSGTLDTVRAHGFYKLISDVFVSTHIDSMVVSAVVFLTIQCKEVIATMKGGRTSIPAYVNALSHFTDRTNEFGANHCQKPVLPS
jgi:hypothetical protein